MYNNNNNDNKHYRPHKGTDDQPPPPPLDCFPHGCGQQPTTACSETAAAVLVHRSSLPFGITVVVISRERVQKVIAYNLASTQGPRP